MISGASQADVGVLVRTVLVSGCYKIVKRTFYVLDQMHACWILDSGSLVYYR